MADIIYAPIGIIYRGEYDPATEFEPLSWVTRDGNSYLCKSLAPIAGAPLPVPPETETAYWVLAARRGAALELRPTETAIQWRLEGGEWADLISIATMTAAAAEAAASATQAGEARASAQAAQGAAEAAQGAAEAAQADARAKVDSITGMVATATTGAPGSDVAVVASVVDGVIRLALTVPQGMQGVPGISPTITAQRQGKTTVVTVVDWEGTKIFEIDDGEDGTGTGNMHTDQWDPDGDGKIEVEKVRGLGEALDGKSPTDHTHTAAEVGARPSGWKPAIGDVEGLGGALAAKANVTTEIPVTIPLGAWQGSAAPFTAEVAVPGVAVDTKGRIGLANGLTPEQREAGRGAMIDVASVGAGVVNLVADGDKPGIDLPAVVMVWG